MLAGGKGGMMIRCKVEMGEWKGRRVEGGNGRFSSEIGV
jgi:hypothetical protein